MTAQDVDFFLTRAFLSKARRELARNGFISDEHSFAPYRDALPKHVDAVEAALRQVGFTGHLKPGFVSNHPDAGYAYFVYDSDRLDPTTATAAVGRWLSTKYKNNLDA